MITALQGCERGFKSRNQDTLKGASGNIGAVKLFSLSDQLEQQLAKEDVSIERLIDELAEDIATLERVALPR